jgi:CRISPR-associated protein Cas1
MKRPYYIFSAGRLIRKENTIFFFPTKEQKPEESSEGNSQASTQEAATALTPEDSACGTEPSDEEILTETLSDEQKESEKALQGDKKVIPIEDIESFYCFGEMNFNSRFLNFLTQHQIPLHTFNYYGFYSGTYYPREYLNSGFLTVKQVQHYLDAGKRLAIAKAFIDGASFNLQKNLRYYNTREVDVQAQIDTIESLRGSIASTQTIQELMGIEGNIRECYYTAFPAILGGRYEFAKRVKQPPNNIVNTLISFGNSLVYTCTLGELYRTQLNPTVSFLHEPGERRFSLSLDLAEVFKPLFTDRIMFKLLNGNMLQEKHFEKRLNCCYLKEEGRKIFVKEFDEKLSTTIQHRTLKKSVSYRRLIRLECYKLIKHLTEDKTYEAFKVWW